MNTTIAVDFNKIVRPVKPMHGINYCDIWNLLWCRIPVELEQKYPGKQ